MHLKQKGFCRFGVLLISTITTITSPPAGAAVASSPPDPESGQGLPHPPSDPGEEAKRPHVDSRRGREPSSPERTPRPGLASSTPVKPREPEGGWVSLSPPHADCGQGDIRHVSRGNFHVSGQLEADLPTVGYQSDAAVSVRAQGDLKRTGGQRLGGSGESWQRLQPVVECGDDAMTLTVRRRRAVQLLLGRVNESSVPLSQLPPQCGYSVQTTWRDFSLKAQYDACQVIQEDDSYVLPLLWRGTPVKMSCPVSQLQPEDVGPSSLCCFPYGLTVKVQGLSATEELRVNVRGEWIPLVTLAKQCGYTLDREDAEIVISAPFITCGITVKDGKYTLSIQIGERTFTLACPVHPPEELPVTHQPLVNRPDHLPRGPTESLEPFPWAPPFYLAPPYYPHPTHRHKYLSPDGHDAFNPPSPSSSSPDPTFGPQPLPHMDSQPDYQGYYAHQIPVRASYKQFGVHGSLSSTDDTEDSSRVYPDLQQKQETPVLGLSEKRSAAHSPSSETGFQSQVEAPPLQPLSHAFNQYYHYYHLPKIPLPGPSQDPDPGPVDPRERSLNNPHHPEFSMSPPSVQQSEPLSSVNSQQFLQPVPEAASHPYTFPTSAPRTPYPPQPYPYHRFYYFPHIARGQAKRLAPLSPDMAAKTNLSDYDLDNPLPHSSEVHDKYNVNPYIDPPKPDKMINFQKHSPERIKHPFLSVDDDDDDVKADDKKRHSAVHPPLPRSYPVVAPPPEQPSFPTPAPNHNLPPHPYYYPSYHYYQMYYGPESLLSADGRVSPTASKEALHPLLQASSAPPQHPSYRKHQTTTPPTKSTSDVYNSGLHPYFYPHLYYQPKVSVNNQELHPAGSMNSEKASSKSESQLPSDSDYRQMGWPVHAAEAGYPSMPQQLHSPFHTLYSHYITQQQPSDPFGHPDGKDTEERLDSDIKDHHKASLHTPAPAPCGLGSVSNLDCSVSLGCCSYLVKDCTMGQHFIFAVMEPKASPPAHPSEVRNVSCTLQRLTSDPDVYIVPLDGCGVNKHVFGQTVVHLLEVHSPSLQQDHSPVCENSPVRLMVEGSSSSGSPGEVRLHVMDQPPPPLVQSTPATVTGQLRIATDESFTSFHPEARLPLSAIRGRPVYLEVSLLDPPEPGLVLLVHSCLAYIQAPYTSWMLVYDGCPSRGDSQLLPSPHSDPHHIRRIVLPSFLSLPSESPSYMAKGGYTHQEEPEIYFLCLTEVCSAAEGDCTVGCINSPNNDI